MYEFARAVLALVAAAVGLAPLLAVAAVHLIQKYKDE